MSYSQVFQLPAHKHLTWMSSSPSPGRQCRACRQRVDAGRTVYRLRKRSETGVLGAAGERPQWSRDHADRQAINAMDTAGR